MNCDVKEQCGREWRGKGKVPNGKAMDQFGLHRKVMDKEVIEN